MKIMTVVRYTKMQMSHYLDPAAVAPHEAAGS